ncbi:MAG: DNA repair protein RadC [Firmicutes bacterium]|nr:DNA repair protein RadC [Bacillota bacterium]MBV1726901.1 DNA repair protein RadC [Desulforudis sp.]MBU4533325.1 DNA repair protein RadC [Bacillota bacterium]MBU4554271.1 DNA repair protein RadC [Bacillota bacterium]MBV1736325.1 DNA repair protein RadC [Desulforudis sp.]
MELGKRIAVAPPDQVDSVRTPNDAYECVQDMRFLDREHFRVLLLTTKHRVIRIETVTIGTLNSSPVHPREVFRPAIKHGACAVVLAHNHPSGDPEPSSQDRQLTQRLVEAGRLIGIEVLDHIIVGDGRFVSLKERGSL